MKNHFNVIFVALLVGLVFACCTSDDDIIDGGVKKSLTFVATSDGSGQNVNASERMKTQLHSDQGNSVTFSADDAISVFDGVGNNKFTTTGSGASVTFKGTAAEAATYTALYPYQTGATISGQTITAVLPTTQTAQSMTYDPQAALSVATTTKEAMKFNFKNVCALVKFTTTEPLTKIVFRGHSGEKVAGNVSIAVSATPTAIGDAESIELLPASPATTIAAGTYYIAVLPQTFKHGFMLEVYRTFGSTGYDDKFSKDFAITLTRSRILNIGEITPNHDYVDLGIEVDGKKILWAMTNVGATTPEGFGDYFAWGETSPYYEAGWSADGGSGKVAFDGTWKTTPKAYATDGYKWTNYMWSAGTNTTLTKYCKDASKGKDGYTDALTKLELDDDAAHVYWGGDWVIPTQAEWQALCDNCTSEWTTLHGVNGRKFTSKINGNSIFLPAAGDFRGTIVDYAGSSGLYWSSSLYAGNNSAGAYGFDFALDKVNPATFDYRYCGQSVRPVIRVTQ